MVGVPLKSRAKCGGGDSHKKRHRSVLDFNAVVGPQFKCWLVWGNPICSRPSSFGTGYFGKISGDESQEVKRRRHMKRTSPKGRDHSLPRSVCVSLLCVVWGVWGVGSEKNKVGEGSTGRGFRADEGRKQRKKPRNSRKQPLILDRQKATIIWVCHWELGLRWFLLPPKNSGPKHPWSQTVVRNTIPNSRSKTPMVNNWSQTPHIHGPIGGPKHP